MPNSRLRTRFLPLIAALAAATWLAACAMTPADPSLVSGAESAIARAEAAGGDEHAPEAMERARERVRVAYTEIESRNGAAAARLADQAELDAGVALAKARAAAARAELERRQAALDALRAELRADFGDDLAEEDS